MIRTLGIAAWLAWLLAGCGGDEPSPAHGAASGAPSSATGTGGGGGGPGGTGAAGSGGSTTSPNHVEVLDQLGEPWVGTTLLVNDADGAVVSLAETDSMGHALVDVPDGGTVSAFFGEATSLNVAAVGEPPDGAPVRFVYPRYLQKDPPAPTQYSVFADGYPPGAAVLHFVSTCDTANAGGLMPGGKKADLTNEYCLDAAQQEFLVVAYDSNLTPLKWGMQTGIATNPGGIVDVAVFLTETSIAAADVSLTNIPGSATRADIDFYPIQNVLNERVYLHESPPSIPTMSGVLQVADVPGTKWLALFGFSIEGNDGSTGLSRRKHLNAWPASDTFSADALAYVSMNALDTTDPIHPMATWLASEGDHGDQNRVMMYWGAATGGVSYSVRLPPDHVTSFRVPDFPPELSSYAPATTSVFGSVFAMYEDYDSTDGYAEALASDPSYDEDHVTSSGYHN